MTARRSAPWVAVIGGLVLLALLTGDRGQDGAPLDPESTGELGTKALVMLLDGLGADVDRTVEASDRHDVTLLLSDQLAEPDLVLLDNWVRAGGTLVVADPGSPLAAAPSDTQFFGGLVEASLPADVCDVAALSGIGNVDGGNAIAYEVLPGDRSCYGDGEAAFVVVRDRGAGTVVSVGGAAAFTNDRLAGSNAVLAATLLAPTEQTRIAFLEPPVAGAGDDGLLDLVSDEVKLALVQVAVAFALYALWRAIRLGRPVLESQPVQIDSSEFVEAVGNLLRERRDPAAVAASIATDATAAINADLGRGRSHDLGTTISTVASRTGRPPEEVRRMLTGGDVQDDDDLVRLAHDLDTLRQELRHGRRVPT